MKNIYILPLLILSSSIFAQRNLKTPHELTVSSPEMASLGKYGTHSIDYFNGKINPNIPLKTMNFDGLTIPIELSYNSGNGILVQQDASWVGLGWSLSIEPSITRSINGLCDFINEPAPSEGYYKGYIHTNIELPIRSDIYPNLISKIESNITNTLGIDPLTGVLKWDIEPDVFTVNLFGRSVQFILTQKELTDGVVKVKLLNPDSNFLVDFNEANKTFVVTDDRGFKFYFDKQEMSATVSGNKDSYPYFDSQPVIPGLVNKLITGWRISKIVSPNNKILTYEYTDSYLYTDIPHYSSSYEAPICFYEGYNSYVDPGKIINKSSSETAHEVSFLKKIISKDEFEIEFLTSNRKDITIATTGPNYTKFDNIFSNIKYRESQKLDKISIKDFKGNDISIFLMDYNYFNENNKEQLSVNKYPQNYLRLKLNKISNTKEILYNMSYIKPDELPEKSSIQTDFFGFYNGKVSPNNIPLFKGSVYCNESIIDNIRKPFYKKINFIRNDDHHLPSANRKPDFNYSQIGMLDKITYPTKGYTKYIFEPNSVEIDSAQYNKLSLYKYEDNYTGSKSQSVSVEYPVESEIIEILNPIQNAIINTLFACAANFQTPGKYEAHQKCTIEERDQKNIAVQLINVDKHTVVKEVNFEYITPRNDNSWYLKNDYVNLEPGRYKLITKGLKHISNFFDEQEGIYQDQNHPDYGKQYNYGVESEIIIPKYLATPHQTYTKTDIGGLRIKEIQNYDNTNELIEKRIITYDSIMNNNYSISSGKLKTPLSFYSTSVKDNVVNGSFIGDCLNKVPFVSRAKYIQVYSNNLLASAVNSNSGVANYTYVKEQILDPKNGSKNGYHEYIFNHYSDDYDLRKSTNNVYLLNVQNNEPYSYGEYFVGSRPTQAQEEKNGDILFKNTYSNTKKISHSNYQYDYPWTIPSDHFNNTVSGSGKVNYLEYNTYDCNYNPISSRRSLSQYLVHTIQNTLSPLIKETKTEFFENSNDSIVLVTNNSYNNKYQLSKQSTKNSKNEDITTDYQYPPDLVGQEDYMKELTDANRITEPVVVKQSVDGVYISEVHNQYNLFNGIVQKATVHQKKGNGININTTTDRKITYNSYDDKGNLTQYTLENGIPVSIIWGYNSQYPIAKIEGASLSEVNSFIQNLETLSNNGTLTKDSFARLRTALPQAMVTGYVYQPLVGITQIIQPNGQTEYYKYDTANRLEEIRNDNQEVLKTFKYNYKQP